MMDYSDKSDIPPTRIPIIILQDVTVKSRNSLNHVSHRTDSPRSVKKRRVTASNYLFEEEPIFSDSEEERQYSKKMLSTLNFSIRIPKGQDGDIQTNLTKDELNILDITKYFENINIENVSEDFKRLLELCKLLQSKYKYVISPVSKKGNFNNSIVSTSSKNSPYVPKLMPVLNFEKEGHEEELAASRNGSTGGKNNDFLSFSFDSGIVNINSIIKSIDSGETKENDLRRSKRIRKPIKPNTSGMVIFGIKKNKKISVKKAVIKKKQIHQRGNKNTTKGRNKINSDGKKESLIRTEAENVDVSNNHLSSSLKSKQRMRRLYSPVEWLHSEELNSLCNTDRRNSCI